MTHDIAAQLSAEERYRLLAENASDIVYQTDGLTIIWISPSVETLLGWSPEDLVGQPASSLVSPNQDVAFIAANRDRLLAGQPVHQEMLLRTREGRDVWFSGDARPLTKDGLVVGGFIVGLHDIDEAVRARRALAASERLYRTAISHAGVGIWLLGADERTIEVNEALCNFLGHPPEYLMAKGWRAVTHADDLPREDELMSALMRGDHDFYRLTKQYIHADGTIRHGDLTVAVVRDDDGSVLLITKQVIDITEATEALNTLTRLARVDSLTDLPNRAAILAELATTLADADSQSRSLAVLFVDLDGFKIVNASLGHAAGDSLLEQVGQRLRDRVPPHATVGRFGSDEFLVVVPGPTDEASLTSFAQEVRDALADDFTVHGRRVVMTASIGAAIAQPTSTPATLLQDADVALSAAKQTGKARFQVFNLSMASAAIRRLVLESELREGIAAEQFVTYYQPVHRFDNGHRTGFEALLRWQHPRDGLLAPSAFLSVAEESGLIIGIGVQALRQVCRDIVAHPSLTETFAVNVSAVQLSDPNWLDSVISIVQKEGADPQRLIIELTETAVMSSTRDLGRDLRTLRNLGIEVHVDDFGTGYSSIALLRDLPITGLKLDRSFTATLTEHGSGYALAEGLAGLTRAIGIDGIAEGVETAEQSTALAGMGWSHGQGWLFGRPSPLDHWLGEARH